MTDCYNYAYLDPTSPVKLETETVCFLFSPLYVGKGTRHRCLHGKIALEEGKHLLTNRLLYIDLKRLQREGFEPEILKFNDGVSSDDALKCEGSIISALGRRNLDVGGILCNRALGGEMPDVTGVPKDPGSVRKMVQTRKKNGSYTTGSAHPRAKTFFLISPTKEQFEITGGLKKFCEDKNLSWQMLFSNQNTGVIQLDRSKHKNLKRLSERFWNTLGWECIAP